MKKLAVTCVILLVFVLLVEVFAYPPLEPTPTPNAATKQAESESYAEAVHILPDPDAVDMPKHLRIYMGSELIPEPTVLWTYNELKNDGLPTAAKVFRLSGISGLARLDFFANSGYCEEHDMRYAEIGVFYGQITDANQTTVDLVDAMEIDDPSIKVLRPRLGDVPIYVLYQTLLVYTKDCTVTKVLVYYPKDGRILYGMAYVSQDIINLSAGKDNLDIYLQVVGWVQNMAEESSKSR